MGQCRSHCRGLGSYGYQCGGMGCLGFPESYTSMWDLHGLSLLTEMGPRGVCRRQKPGRCPGGWRSPILPRCTGSDPRAAGDAGHLHSGTPEEIDVGHNKAATFVSIFCRTTDKGKGHLFAQHLCHHKIIMAAQMQHRVTSVLTQNHGATTTISFSQGQKPRTLREGGRLEV